MTVFSFSKTVLKNLFSKPVTRAYPQKPREYPDRTRGHVQIDMDQCILCGLCSRKCPADAIQVNRAEGTWSINRFGCIQCASCVESCPKKCLSMGRAYSDPGPEKVWEAHRKPTAAEPPAPGHASAPKAEAAKKVQPAMAAGTAKPAAEKSQRS